MLGLEGAVGELDVRTGRAPPGSAGRSAICSDRLGSATTLSFGGRVGRRIAGQAKAFLLRRRRLMAGAAAEHGVQAEQDHRGDHGRGREFPDIARSALSEPSGAARPSAQISTLNPGTPEGPVLQLGIMATRTIGNQPFALSRLRDPWYRRPPPNLRRTRMMSATGALPGADDGVDGAPRIQVVAQYVKDLSFENPGAPASVTVRPQIDLGRRPSGPAAGEPALRGRAQACASTPSRRTRSRCSCWNWPMPGCSRS